MSIPFFTVCAWHDPLSSTPSNVGQAPAGQTIREFVESSTEAHVVPTLIIHNGELVLEEHFDRVIAEHDVVSLLPMPGVIDWAVVAFWSVIVSTVLLSAAAVYMVLTAPVPDEFGRGSTTYSLSYRGNRRKPGQPIPVVYGKMRTYPDVTGSYTYYAEDGDQFLVQIFDVSQGKCDITDIQYEDTPVENFDSEGAELEILMPGQASDLFPHEVFVSTEVAQVEPPHAAGSFSPFYVAQPPGETINAIELDIVAPNGIYSVSTDGDLRSHTRTIGLYAYHVDADGDPTTLYAYREVKIGGAKSTSAIRRTFRFKVPKGRYGVKVERVNDVDPRQRYSTLWTWNGLRGFSPDKSPLTTTTRVALRVRASESLGNASLGQFNVLAERYLPSWSPGTGWSAQPVKTTNAMAAFADILRAPYGARISDKQIDLQALYDLSLRPLADFNGVFDEEITVWEALNAVCLPVLARPIELPGGIYSAVPDDPAVAPSALFTMRNMVKGTFNIQHVGVLESTNDSVEVTYSNASEGYRQTSILCKPAGEAGTNPKRVEVKGVTSKEAAYEVGIRMANENKWRRKMISFETGLEGYLPTFGDTIRVHHYLLGLEQATPAVSGEAKAYDSSEGGITVWEDLTHLVGKTGLQVYLRGKEGEPFGPVSCTVPSMNFINFTSSTSGWTPVFSDSHAGPLYCVGKASDFMALVKVTNTEPMDRHRVRIEGAVDNPNVYIKGAQPSYSPINLPAKLFPRIENLTWTRYGRDSIKVSWRRIHGDYAIVEQSLDGGVKWDQIFKTTRNFVTGVPPRMTNYKVRVAGVSVFQGPWSTLTIDTVNYTLASPPMTRLRLAEAFDGKELRVIWDKPPAGFVPFFEVWWNGAKKVTYTLPGGTTQAGLPYTNVMAVEATSYGGLTLPKDGSRTLTIKGFYKNSESGALSTTPAVLVAKNPQLTALYGAGYTERGANLNIYFDLPSTGDFAWAEVYLSQTAGFTPGPSTLVGRYASNDINLVGILAHATPYYLRIAGVDVWGRDGIVYSNEVMITTEDAVIDGTISYSQITGSKPPIDATRNIVYYQATTPPSGQVGDYWYNTSTGRLNQYVSGTGWAPISTNQKTFSRTTPPTNPADNLVAGDMWHDSDSPNETLYRWDGSAWVLVATNGTSWDTIGFRPSDAELLNSLQEWDQIKDATGKRPANNATKNAFYKQNTAPAGVVGDLWYCTQTGSGYTKDILYRYSGSAWTDYGNGYFDTSQLADGAELGKKADWSRILNDGGKPENNATKNTITYASVAPGTGTSGDLFVDSDTGLMYKWEGGGWKLVASSIQVYQQDTQPTSPYDGDLWYDTGADNVRKEMRRYVAAQAAWQVVATKGATWSVDIAGQPTDAAILNAYQEWDQIQDSTGKRPANNATKNVFYRQTTAPAGVVGDLWYCTQTGGGYTKDVLYRYTGSAWTDYGNGYYDTSQLADGAELGKKADWSRILNDGGKPENNATKNTITYASVAPGTGTSGDLFVDSDTGLMYKWEAGGWKMVASSIQVFQQDAQPSVAYDGDLWYDTGADNPRKEMKRYNGSSWQVVSTKGATWGVDLMGQPTDAALLNSLQEWNDIKDTAGVGKPANYATRNTFFKQTTAPAGVVGDLWYCTQTGGGFTKDVLYRWSGSAWTDYGNGYFDTSQLADGAELGKKADWSRILNDGGKPENNATKNTITYASNAPGSGTSGDLFVDSDTGLMYKWEGGTWKLVASSIQVYQQDAQPSTAYAGDLWYDTGADNTRKEMRRYTGSAWQVVSTNGATWSVDLIGQPSDAALLNSLQEWDQIQGAGKPVSNATRNRIFYATGGGSAPLSSLQVEYQLEEYGSGTTLTTSADSSGKGDTLTQGAFSGGMAWYTGAGGRGLVWNANNTTANFSYMGKQNINSASAIGPAMTGKRQWSVILVTESVVSESASIYGSLFVLDRETDPDDTLQFGVTVNSAGAVRVTWGGSHSVTWANAGANSGRKVWHVVMDLDAAGVNRAKLYKDGVLQTATTDNSGGTAPNYTASATWLLLGINVNVNRNMRGGALYYAAMYDGVLNSSQITATLSALAANDDTSLLSGGGGSEPAGANGDLWYNPSTKVLAQHNGSAWVAIGNDFRDTSLLADGAGLGTKADWSKVFDDGGRPANGATVNTFYYQDVAPTGGNAGDLWFEGDTGFVYKREAGAWLPVATNVYIFRQTGVPTNGNVGDLWYDTDDAERPLYRLRVKPSSTFANWDRIATDGASWGNVTNKPDLATPSGDKGSLLVDGTLDKTAAYGDPDFNRYFTYIGSSAYVKLFSDAKYRLFELKGSGLDAGLYDKKKYKASTDQTIYVSLRALKAGVTGSTPTLRIGGRVYDKAGAVLGLDYYTVNVSAISTSTWLWFHGSFKVSRADSFAIEPGFWLNGVTGGTVYVDDVFIGYAPARVTSASMPQFMEALAVDSLYIANQAVTVPQYFFSENIQSFSATGNTTAVYFNIMSGPITFVDPNSVALFNCTVQIYGASGYTQTDGSKYIQLLRGSTNLRRFRLFTEVGAPNNTLPGVFSFSFHDLDHGTGSPTYSLQIGVSSPSAGGTMWVHVKEVSISVVEARK